ncbi:TRAP transporter substrate-binding protein DctP [Marinivivus vitaminiproducens]|uniref:TRAP transporter substrate-binding protein DctP n=1 Tax=Marinivivus vitaminiproducens TaxID=3035935 RepID=UPI00279FE64F|nr:TRAP transporter substrate-binding protein DctP [Geminicoccaceae bacterium SCSIO 64248]
MIDLGTARRPGALTRRSMLALTGTLGTAWTLGGRAGRAQEPAHTFRVALQYPLSSNLGDNLIEFKDLVEVISNGSIQVDIIPDGRLVADERVPEAVASGEIEMGVATTGALGFVVPLADVFQIPFIFTTNAVVRDATSATSPIRQAIDGGLLEKGARVLWWQAGGSAVTISRDEPVRLPEDLNGKTVAVGGELLSHWVAQLGGKPVQPPPVADYGTERTEAIDVAMVPADAVRSARLDRYMRGFTATNHVSFEHAVLINDEVWQRLDRPQKQVIEEASLRVERVLRGSILQTENQAAAYPQSVGMEVHQLSVEETLAWQRSGEQAAADYIARTGEAGQRLLDVARQLEEPGGQILPN